ncbi:(Fe-S)-binding protein, partial [Phreatobacter sp.]|uniref:(Fe-S)-binding protein n=1 Tax=Phreatobacter sp. TaxID=1966341 RepID=UPI0025CBD595
MSVQPPSSTFSLIPDTAPFSAEQRQWLSGFFAAALGPLTPAAAMAADGGAATAPSAELASNDDAPWHDPAMPLADRMALADGKPLAPRLMAAMAQQDCGQCGYSCADYANALAVKSEERLNLCVPGGKETLRMLKALAGEVAGSGEAGAAPAAAPPAG